MKFDIQTFSMAAFYLFSPALVLDSLVNPDDNIGEFCDCRSLAECVKSIIWTMDVRVLAVLCRLKQKLSELNAL